MLEIAGGIVLGLAATWVLYIVFLILFSMIFGA